MDLINPAPVVHERRHIVKVTKEANVLYVLRLFWVIVVTKCQSNFPLANKVNFLNFISTEKKGN